MLSTTKTHYSRLRDISTCTKLSEEDYICHNPTVYSALDRPVCEVSLKDRFSDHIPEDCSTHTIKANIEIWHPLSSNSWLFITSQNSIASVSCERSNTHIIDVPINGTGIFRMKPKCKCYTFSTVLSSTSNDSRIYHNFVPNFNIVTDDCCIQKHNTLHYKEYLMNPMDLTNLNLDELRHSQHKLEQFDEILQKSINEPFFSNHTSWFTISILLSSIFLLIILCCCCNCSWIPYFGKYFPKRKTCCGITPNICITNHNERFEISEEQAYRLSHLRRIYDNEEDVPVQQSRELEPVSKELVRCTSASARNSAEPRSRKSVDKRFQV